MTEIMPFPENNYETVLLDRPFGRLFYGPHHKLQKTAALRGGGFQMLPVLEMIETHQFFQRTGLRMKGQGSPVRGGVTHGQTGLRAVSIILCAEPPQGLSWQRCGRG